MFAPSVFFLSLSVTTSNNAPQIAKEHLLNPRAGPPAVNIAMINTAMSTALLLKSFHVPLQYALTWESQSAEIFLAFGL